MPYNSTTTLAAIRAAGPCADGWQKLCGHLEIPLADAKHNTEPLPLLTVLVRNGLDDALWVLSRAMPDDRLARHFQAWCVEQVLHIFEAEFPGDARVRNQINTLRDDEASSDQRYAARAAAWAAAQNAAQGDVLAVARGDVRAAAQNAKKKAAWDVARAAAQDDVRYAARAAAWAAAQNAAQGDVLAVARGAAQNAQERQLRAILLEAA